MSVAEQREQLRDAYRRQRKAEPHSPEWTAAYEDAVRLGGELGVKAADINVVEAASEVGRGLVRVANDIRGLP